MKKIIPTLLVLLMLCGTASATILPATGVDEDFAAWTGIECTPAVILCESLSVLDARGDQGGKKVEALLYSGKTIPVIESWDGYAKIYYSDGNKTGWVRSDYLLFDPAWYVCDEDVQVYAYPDVMAPRVALLDKGTKLPIITEWEDGKSISGWVCVSLRGAAGWIRKTPADTAGETWFRPEMLTDITLAMLTCDGVSIYSSDRDEPEKMVFLSELLTHAEDMGGMVAGCPFTATLKLCLWDGQVIEMQLATDSCCVYRVDGRDYQYARHVVSDDDSSPNNAMLFNLFGMDSFGNFAVDIPDGNAYCGGQTPLYRSTDGGDFIALLPSGTRVRWLSSTEDRAYGLIEALVNGRTVQGYAPWEKLQTFEDGTESARAMAALIARMGWSQVETAAYQLYTPVMKQQNQFICVTVMSATEPQWRFHVWLDQLTGGVYDITFPQADEP